MTNEQVEILTIWMDRSGYWVGALSCTSRTIYGLSVDRVRSLGRSYVDECFPSLSPGDVKLVERIELRGIHQHDQSCLKLDGHKEDDTLDSEHFTRARRTIEAVAKLRLAVSPDHLARWTGMSLDDVEQILRSARDPRTSA